MLVFVFVDYVCDNNVTVGLVFKKGKWVDA